MQIIVRGHGLEVTDYLRDYVHKRMSKIEQFFRNVQKAEVNLEAREVRDAGKRQVCQVTLWAAGTLIRAEEATGDMYSSIDMVFAILEGQIKKHKDKLIHETRRQAHKHKLEESLAPPSVPKEPVGPVIVKVKRFALKPMSPLEAADQMELLRHNFFMFLNSKTHEINVVYRRKSGNYGLIEPEL